MKTLLTLLFLITLSTTSVNTMSHSHSNFALSSSKSNATVIAAPRFFQLRESCAARTFMPYAEDPCNHLPTRKSYC